MNILLIADMHLTDLPRDEYRWSIFPWIAEMVHKHKIDLVAILGDVTDSKDKHSGELANRLVDAFDDLGDVVWVIFDPGNHDGIQEGRPFFRFINHIRNVTCLTKPLVLDQQSLPLRAKEIVREKLLFLPNTRDYETAWADLDFSAYDYIFCHQTFDGCLTENGTRLGGIPPAVFGKTKARVFSGDIHVPQKIGKNIEYVGAPYRIRFGDSFTPRCLLLKIGHEQQDLHFPTTMKFLIEVEGDNPLARFRKELNRLDVCKGDQVKLRVSLLRSEYSDWPALREALIAAALKAGIELWGPELHAVAKSPGQTREAGPGRASPAKALQSYARRERLSGPLLDAGKSFLAGALEGIEK